MKYEIKHRFNDNVLFSADIPDGTGSGMMARISLEQAAISGADLSGADLRWADLSGADLMKANLSGADLIGADLFNANGNRQNVISLQLERYCVAYTHDRIQIGCQNHEISRWWKFTDAQIKVMDDGALEWWRKWKPILKQIIEMSPAKPTGYKREWHE